MSQMGLLWNICLIVDKRVEKSKTNPQRSDPSPSGTLHSLEYQKTFTTAEDFYYKRFMFLISVLLPDV